MLYIYWYWSANIFMYVFLLLLIWFDIHWISCYNAVSLIAESVSFVLNIVFWILNFWILTISHQIHLIVYSSNKNQTIEDNLVSLSRTAVQTDFYRFFTSAYVISMRIWYLILITRSLHEFLFKLVVRYSSRR